MRLKAIITMVAVFMVSRFSLCYSISLQRSSISRPIRITAGISKEKCESKWCFDELGKKTQIWYSECNYTDDLIRSDRNHIRIIVGISFGDEPERGLRMLH